MQKGFLSTDRMYALGGFLLAALLAFLIVLGINGLEGGSVKSSQAQQPSSSSTAPATSVSTNPYAVLAPATVPSKVAECSQAISFASNGTSGPVQCANGNLNIKEWSALAANEPTVMTLGYSPTLSQVENAICTDVKNTQSDANTNNASQIEGVAYQISNLYYGWNFSSANPMSVLSSGKC